MKYFTATNISIASILVITSLVISLIIIANNKSSNSSTSSKCPKCHDCPDCPNCSKCPNCPNCPSPSKCPNCPDCPDCPSPSNCPNCPNCPSSSNCPNSSNKKIGSPIVLKGSDIINSDFFTHFKSPTWFPRPDQNSQTSSLEPTKGVVMYIDGLLDKNGSKYKVNNGVITNGCYKGTSKNKLIIKPLLSENANEVYWNKTGNGVANPKSTIQPINTIRLESNILFNSGIFIIKLSHIPGGWGSWPAWWLSGQLNFPNSWALNGEIDIIEGGWGGNNLKNFNKNTTSLHNSNLTFKNPCNPLGKCWCGYNSNQCCDYDGSFFEWENETSFGNGFNKKASETGKSGGYVCKFTSHINGAQTIDVWFYEPGNFPTKIDNDNYDGSDFEVNDINMKKTILNCNGYKSIYASTGGQPNPDNGGCIKINASDNKNYQYKNMALILNTTYGGDALNNRVPSGLPPVKLSDMYNYANKTTTPPGSVPQIIDNWIDDCAWEIDYMKVLKWT